jgi:hypothetical protein
MNFFGAMKSRIVSGGSPSLTEEIIVPFIRINFGQFGARFIQPMFVLESM